MTAPQQYRVTGEYITVKTAVMGSFLPGVRGNGYTVVGLYKGALLPPDVAQERIDSLLTAHFIEPVSAEV